MDIELVKLHSAYGKHEWENLGGTLVCSSDIYYCKCGLFTLWHEPILMLAWSKPSWSMLLEPTALARLSKDWEEYRAMVDEHLGDPEGPYPGVRKMWAKHGVDICNTHKHRQ